MIKDYKNAIENIRTHLKNKLIESKLQSLIIGVSGGIDSALVCALAKPVCDELGVKLIGRSLTIQTNKEDERKRADDIGNNFCSDYKEVNLSEYYYPLRDFNDIEDKEGLVGVPFKIRMGNIKARMRMMYLYNLAHLNNGMVLSTDNYTEFLLGFFTLHGDVGDYGMIQEIWKTEVYEMTEWLSKNVVYLGSHNPISASKSLKACVDAVATDGLGITSSDLEQILPTWKGSSRKGYEEVDRILINILTNSNFNDKDNPVYKRYISTEFKRHNPFNIERKDIIKQN